MIINLRGTGGSGKSTLVRTVMSKYPGRTPHFIDGRKQPLAYLCTREFKPPLYVPGHYETPTGGCDTIQKPDMVYELVTAAAQNGCDVLYEGIMIGDDVRRCVELSKAHPPLKVIALSTPIEECLKGIQSRRDTRGDDRELNPKNTISRLDRLKKSMIPRLKDAGVDCKWLSREQALVAVLSALGLDDV
jgi:predicted kinase